MIFSPPTSVGFHHIPIDFPAAAPMYSTNPLAKSYQGVIVPSKALHSFPISTASLTFTALFTHLLAGLPLQISPTV